jgi:hypothetical protein
MSGEFTINGQNTYTQWGIVLAPGSVEQLLALPPAKDYVINESRLESGVRVLTSGTAMSKDADREVTLEVHLLATDATDFKTKYAAFLSYIRSNRELVVVTSHSSDAYHFIYRSCNAFSDWDGRVCHIALRLWEPNPGNRASGSSN